MIISKAEFPEQSQKKHSSTDGKCGDEMDPNGQHIRISFQGTKKRLI